MSKTSISKTRVAIDEEVNALMQESLEQSTILHCTLVNEEASYLRIWPGTFLIEDNGVRRELVKAFNISLMPEWTSYPAGNQPIKFTLVFEGLSKTCGSFYLLEDIPQPGGFFTDSILRNKTDVYNAEVSSKR
jgi:hypothetical protein